MIVTRFAPSPTGDLHIGSVRTALYSWLYARKRQGKAILRIEDTDLARSTQAAVQVIIDGLAWLGLNFDEGPIYQSQRFERYREVAQGLLASKAAYKCYCSHERLERLREQQTAAKEKTRYDGHCRDLPEQETAGNYVIRLKTPLTGVVSFQDVVRGTINFNNSELDDLILVRSDGVPTYNFTVVVDDWDMQVTHVLRGDDHINNTPRQIHIFNALGATLPQFGHLSMLLGPDGKKLSKRAGTVSVLDYQQQGILPQALLNYLLRLGWSYQDKEIFSLEEMIDLFNLEGINVSACAVNPEKLLWLNQHYLKNLPLPEVVEKALPYLQALNVDLEKGPAVQELVRYQRERCKTLVEIATQSLFLYQPEVADALLVEKYFSATIRETLQLLCKSLVEVLAWEEASLDAALKNALLESQLKMGQLAPALRIALSGSINTLPLTAMLFLLGKSDSLERLQAYCAPQAE